LNNQLDQNANGMAFDNGTDDKEEEKKNQD
jgi:hypothetical protein